MKKPATIIVAALVILSLPTIYYLQTKTKNTPLEDKTFSVSRTELTGGGFVGSVDKKEIDYKGNIYHHTAPTYTSEIKSVKIGEVSNETVREMQDYFEGKLSDEDCPQYGEPSVTVVSNGETTYFCDVQFVRELLK